MVEAEKGRDLISVLWSGADILRSKMDANEYKDYLLGIVFYKYLSDAFLIKVYDLVYDEKPETLKEALEVTEETVKAVAQEKPYYAVFRDSCMANDSVATNFEQIFATYSPETVRKVL